MKIAYIGLGNMGAPMAANLIRAGFELIVHDVGQDKSARLVEAGARWAGSIEEAVSGALPAIGAASILRPRADFGVPLT